MRVALAVDITSPHPEHLVDAAQPMLTRLATEIDLVHVQGARYSFEHLTSPHIRDLLEVEAERMRADDEASLRRLATRLPEAIPAGVALLPGGPVEALIDASRRYDVVFVGTHGRTGIAHFWLGSVAGQVVRRAECPVVVIRVPGP